jgi:hypothetical protein
MGVFFKTVPTATDPVEDLFREALESPALPGPQADAEAKTKAAAAKGAAAPVEINVRAFVAAGVVFLALLVAAYVTADAAIRDGAAETAMDTLTGAVRELLVAWSAAVLGLIGGEAVGARSA